MARRKRSDLRPLPRFFRRGYKVRIASTKKGDYFLHGKNTSMAEDILGLVMLGSAVSIVWMLISGTHSAATGTPPLGK